MRRAFGIVCIVSIIYVSALIIGFFSYSLKEQEEMQLMILSAAIDFSSDAAMAEVLEGDSLDTDYSEDGYVMIDPTVAFNTFVDFFCMNYNIALTGEARDHVIQNYIPVACMACYDGYYVATRKPVKNAVGYNVKPKVDENDLHLMDVKYDVVFGPKLPYTYKNSGDIYALNMGMENSYAIISSTLCRRSLVPQVFSTKSAGIAEINKILSDEIAFAVNSANENKSGWGNSFFIPSQLTSLSGVRPIDGPSLIVLVQNVDLTSTRPISGFSVSGSKLGNSRMVVGYARLVQGVSRSCYCYSDQFSAMKAGVGQPAISIIDVFSNARDAAKSGYYFDPYFIK